MNETLAALPLKEFGDMKVGDTGHQDQHIDLILECIVSNCNSMPMNIHQVDKEIHTVDYLSNRQQTALS